MDLESYKQNIRRHLESCPEETLVLTLKLVMAEMERRRPAEVYKPATDEEFLKSCGVRWD